MQEGASSSSSSSSAAATASGGAAFKYALERQFTDSRYLCLTLEQQMFADAMDKMVHVESQNVWAELAAGDGARIMGLQETGVQALLLDKLMKQKSSDFPAFSWEKEAICLHKAHRADLVVQCTALQLKLVYELKRASAWAEDAYSGLRSGAPDDRASFKSSLWQVNSTQDQMAVMVPNKGQFLVRAQALINFPKDRGAGVQFFPAVREISATHAKCASVRLLVYPYIYPTSLSKSFL